MYLGILHTYIHKYSAAIWAPDYIHSGQGATLYSLSSKMPASALFNLTGNVEPFGNEACGLMLVPGEVPEAPAEDDEHVSSWASESTAATSEQPQLPSEADSPSSRRGLAKTPNSLSPTIGPCKQRPNMPCTPEVFLFNRQSIQLIPRNNRV